MSVRYGDFTAVDNVSVTIDRGGHILALLGPSGSGKSTVLRGIAGLEPLTSGTVSFDGEDITNVPVHKRNIGLVFQDGQLFPHRTVTGNIEYGLTVGSAARRAVGDGDTHPKLTKAERSARVDELLDLVGLVGYGSRRVDQLSGGEAQRVALARALAPRPRLLLLDEPLSALDRGLRDRLAIDVRHIVAESHTPTLVVTHDHSEAAFLADEIAVIIDGTIRQVSPPRLLWRNPADTVVAKFLGFESFLDAHIRHGVARCALGAVGVDGPDGDAVLALGQHSLVVAPHGPVEATVVSVVVLPDGLRMRVMIDGVGECGAAGTLYDDVVVGQSIRLGLDGRRTGVIVPPNSGSPSNRSHVQGTRARVGGGADD
ncbi:ABC transporter ATP-binding protein [Hoyosella rhizosphaerae]|nr:ABC transporter ATP-binding protein [Hoyosella rhizosphaerae]